MPEGPETYPLTYRGSEKFSLFPATLASPWFGTNGSLTVLSSSVPKPLMSREEFLFVLLRTLDLHVNTLHLQAHAFPQE